MSDKIELPKAYEPADHEPEISKKERESGFYTPENLPGDRKEMFSMVLPPPNATGTLHMGHAVMLAIQDIMVRFQRMRGKKTLWLPGTDHAAIATQVKVEKILMKEEGKSRHDLGREEFLKRVDKFVEGSRATINHQVREMGSSIDWTREAFTLDEPRNLAVRTMFKKMYDDGLIYRGHRVINWDPVGQTVISNDELVTVERTAKMYTFKYSKDFPITIATTRPETKVGDTAVAVHPDDDRYKDLIGNEYDVDFAGAKLKIKIVADNEVEREFGSGALGVTPAHSVTDEDIAKRHNLEMVQVIDEDARMTEKAGDLVRGMTTLEAREKIVDWLRDNDLLESEEDVAQNVTTAERTGAVIEPLPKLQWFVDVEKEYTFKQSKRAPIKGLEDGQKLSIKSSLQHAVRSGEVSIIPERFDKQYFHWVDNYRPWCISRQLWYGHRIPVWYKGDEVYVDVKPPEGDGWVQESDVLDTWFSAGMWTFSTLGWPNEGAADLHSYHPTTMLETGYDILPIWVVRMIFMSVYALGEVPFKYAYMHGLVRDDQGRKMSKSLDNIIDPLAMKAQFGTDATRLSLMMGNTPGNDTNLSEDKIAGYRNFTNKLWNVARFVLMSVDEIKLVDEQPEARTEADAWILNKLNTVIANVTEKLDEPKFEISGAGEELRGFTWGDFADWYLEVAKVQLENDELKESTEEVLLYTLQSILKMWHPFMPFVTTKLWESINPSTMLLVEDWPVVTSSEGGKAFDRMKDIVTAIRATRAAYRVEPAKKIDAIITGSSLNELDDLKDVIMRLGRLENLEIVSDAKKPEGSVSEIAGGVTIYIPLEGMVDFDAERVRLTKELEGVSKYVFTVGKKLSNKGFTDNAPADAVEKERAKLKEATIREAALNEQLEALG